MSGKALSVFLLSSMSLSLLLSAARAYAAENTEELEDFPENYISTVYDNTTGMMSAEANVVEQTDDGCIWIGSYAGLTRYNGVNFEFVSDGGIVNVTAMHCDAKGNLWIGTNDGGVVRYCDDSFSFFTKEDGLPSNSIRSFSEDDNGTIYLGTLDGICCFDKFDNITVVNPNIDFVISMLSMGDGTLAAVDNAGDLYILKNGEIIQQFEALGTNLMYYCIKDTSKGILVGTSDGSLKRLETKNGKWTLVDTSFRVSGEISMITEDKYSRIWICSSNGYGYLNDEGIYVNVTPKGQESNYEWIMEDYQGNIWLTSNRSGVTKLSESRFSMLFGQGEVENVVVNAVVEYDSMYYCATDNGLIIMDRERNYIENELTDYLSGVRIRHLMVDSKNQLWISTYGEMGLVRYTISGEKEIYNIAEKGSTSDRFRCSRELSDGTVVAGAAEGINFIKEDQIVNTLTAEKDHLPNSQILTLVETADGIMIIADCTCDLPDSLLEQHDIGLMFFYICTETGRFRDREEITAVNVFEHTQQGRKVHSSAPACEEYTQFVEKNLQNAKEIIYLTISSKISESYQNCIAAKDCLGEMGRRIHVIDTLHVSTGSGHLVLRAAQLAEQKKSAEEIVRDLERFRERVSTSFIVKNADYLYKNGKVSRVVQKACSLFKLHPVLAMKHGNLRVKRIFWGNYESAQIRYVNREMKRNAHIKKDLLFITHAGCTVKELTAVRKEIDRHCLFDTIMTTNASATVSSNCGPNSVGVLYVTGD